MLTPGIGAQSPHITPGDGTLQYSMLMEHLVGDKRRPKEMIPGGLGGVLTPIKSDEQKTMERVMESCAFKAALACVGGECEGPEVLLGTAIIPHY